MSPALRRLLAGLLAAPCALACASVENGGLPQRLRIDSRPSGASVLVLPEEILLETPAELRLERRLAHTLRFERPGYCREVVYIDRLTTPSRDLNWLLLVFAPLGIWRDTATGAAYRLSPDQVNVHLWPADSPERECGPAGALRRLEQEPAPEPL